MSGDADQRIADLEARFAFLDDQVQALDDLVTAQRDTLDALHRELKEVRDALRAQTAVLDSGGPEPPPPHY